MNASNEVLSVDNLTVVNPVSGRTLLKELSFTINKGELIGLVGPSGSGKSTLVHSLLGLLPRGLEIEKGRVVLDQIDLTSTPERDFAGIRGRLVSVIFQDPLASLNPVLPCGVQIEEPLKIHGNYSAKERYELVMEVLREVGFPDPARVYHSLPRKLSGGQRQRVMLGMAIVFKPLLLIADEPTSALDKEAAEHLIELISELRNRRGLSVLLISHDRKLVGKHAGRLLFMEEGRLTQVPVRAQPGVPRLAAAGTVSTEASLLKVRSLTKNYAATNFFLGSRSKVTALKDVSFDIFPGEVFGIIGPSGSGKTTLGRCIAGLESPDSGRIELAGKKVTRLRASWKRRPPHPVQVIYQSPYASLHPLMSVGRAIEEALPHKINKASKQRRVAELLDQVDLPQEYYTHLPERLSGGERQRVVIARCLAGQPTLLVADEPTASLDETVKEQVLDILVHLAQTTGLAVLLISHDMDAVKRSCSRNLSMVNGTVGEISSL